MKIIPAKLAKSYVRSLNTTFKGSCIYRPEHIRIAVREHLRNELLSSEILDKEAQQTNNVRFFDCCINCEKNISFPFIRNHFFHKNIEIFKLQFCCSCYRQFKDKSFDEFPEELIDKILKKIKAYKRENVRDLE